MEEKKSKNIKRIMSGLIGFPIIALILIFSNDLVMDIALAVISIIGTYEFFKCFKSKEKANPSKWYAMIISACFFKHYKRKIYKWENYNMVRDSSFLGK